MDEEDQMVHNYPSCRKTMKFTLSLLHMATLDISILLKKIYHKPRRRRER